MDNDLNRSVRLLDAAVSADNRNLLRRKFGNLKKKNLNLSITLLPDELAILESSAPYIDQTYNNTTMNFTTFNKTFDSTFNNIVNADKTLTGSVIRTTEPWKNATDSLYMEFLEILQTHSNSNDVLDIVAEMSRCCSDTLAVVKALKSKVNIQNTDSDQWLENERNTWRLLFVLYGNRLNVPHVEDDIADVDHYYGQSEKLCILSLFKRDCLVRESQLVIDWLECNAAQKDEFVLHMADSTMGWENTLHQLLSKETIVFESTREIVKHLDPDAPHYEEKPLHDIDMDDEKKLCKKVFSEIRCGKLENAQKICGNCGHFWRAALLDGWKLHHNPNRDDPFAKEFEDIKDPEKENETEMDNSKQLSHEGNPNRDIWKIMAWNYCNMESLDTYEKAAVGAYCGNLESLLYVCNNWEDHLWAYMRVMIDLRVESEIRENVSKRFEVLPDEYWDQKMSINEIFTCLESSKVNIVQQQASSTEHIIQKYLILDEINKLVNTIEDWIMEPNLSTQFLRFVTHLLLFLEQIGQVNNRDVVERVIEEYIKRLVDMRQTQIIAYYVSKLNENMQVHIFASYLETITDNDERKESLGYADDSGLNVFAITTQVVENVRGWIDICFDGGLQQKINARDLNKISALDWLLFHKDQIPEALKQTNATIFTFLTLKKLDAAQLAFNKLPVDVVKKVLDVGDVPDDIQQYIREYLSYKAYFDAQEAFNIWFKHHSSKPVEPANLGEHAQFTEKVAHQHRMSQFKADTERWKLAISQLAKLAKTALYNILLFPDGGWLSGAQDADYLRSNIIPECSLLLFNVLYNSNQHEESVQLADIIISEKFGLYKAYSTEKLGELFVKLSESSIALLNEKKDPWGNETSA